MAKQYNKNKSTLSRKSLPDKQQYTHKSQTNNTNSTEGFFVRPVDKSTVAKPEKKPFDKKKYRLKKYSNKYKLDNWEEKRKKAILRGYFKEKDDNSNEAKLDVAKIYEEASDDEEDEAPKSREKIIQPEEDESTQGGSAFKKRKAYKRAHLEYDKIQQEKERKREDFKKAKAEREEALKEYKQKKLEKYKKLNKKTRKGQPIMKNRLEDLLEKIQSSIVNDAN